MDVIEPPYSLRLLHSAEAVLQSIHRTQADSIISIFAFKFCTLSISRIATAAFLGDWESRTIDFASNTSKCIESQHLRGRSTLGVLFFPLTSPGAATMHVCSGLVALRHFQRRYFLLLPRRPTQARTRDQFVRVSSLHSVPSSPLHDVIQYSVLVAANAIIEYKMKEKLRVRLKSSRVVL